MTDPHDSSVLHQMIGDPERKRLLVVDDEETMRLAISRFLQSRGYEIDQAESAHAALGLLEQNRYSAMICDVRMPGMSGVDLIPRALDIDPEMAVMMLTAVTDSSVAAQSLSRGAGEYLMKPVELGELQIALERVLNKRSITKEQRSIERLISSEVERLTASLTHDRDETFSRSIEALATAVVLFESTDPYFAGTSARVAAISGAIADFLALDDETKTHLNSAARLHDIGRFALRDALLHKPGPLDSDEAARVREHVQFGLEVLSHLILLGPVLDFVGDHHERWDGTGYPHGRNGDRISIGGRILAVSDAFVSLTSRRPYRDAVQPEAAIALLSDASGTQYDPAVTHALSVIVSERHVFGLTAD